MTPPTQDAPVDAVRSLSFGLTIDRDQGPDASGRIPVVFSSEYAVERYDWWADQRYLEVLDHSPNAIDMTRAANGLPFLDSHEMRAQLGRVENIGRREDGKLAGWLRFSQRQEAQDYRQDILDGIRGEVSVGYRIDPASIDIDTRNDAVPTYTVRKWTPIEVSGVSIPADPTVGAFRSGVAPRGALPRPLMTTRAEPVVATRVVPQDPTTIPAPAGQESKMSVEETSVAPAGATVTVTRSEGETPDTAERRRSVAQLAAQHAVEDVFARGMSEGKDLDAVQRDMFNALKERAANGPRFDGRVQLTDKEERSYSFATAILAADTGEKCFEREISDELAKKLPQGYKPAGTGLFVPTNLGQRAAIVAGTSSIGGAMVFTQAGSFIDLLRNKAFVIQAGATVLPGLSAPVSFPKQNGAGTAYWVAEAGSDVTESNLTFALVSLTPKTVQATQAFSRQLLVQASTVQNVEQLVRNDLAQLHALAIDAAAISGTGTSQPLGITKSTAVGTVTMGAAGAVPTYDALIDQEVQIRSGNVDGGLAYLTTPGIAGRLKKTQKFATTNGEAVWTGDLVNGTLNGAPAFATNQVPSNLTKGTSTTICHAIIAGAFQNLLIGEFGMAEIITDPFAKKKQGLIEVTSFQMVDVAWRHDAAFSVILDAKLS